MPRGGARPGAGRRKKSEVLGLYELIDAHVTQEDWAQILRAAVEEAKGCGKSANVARDWLCSYRWGPPPRFVAQQDSSARVGYIEYVADNFGIAEARRARLAALASPTETVYVDGEQHSQDRPA